VSDVQYIRYKRGKNKGKVKLIVFVDPRDKNNSHAFTPNEVREAGIRFNKSKKKRSKKKRSKK
jgi:hypothetical protein